MRWIKECISTTTYRVVVNGDRSDIIKPTRGIRQRDSLSPYLFIMLADVLSRWIKQETREERLKGIMLIRRFPKLHHLFFTDDSLLFRQGSTVNAKHLKDILDAYCRASGQRINTTKSTLFFNRVWGDWEESCGGCVGNKEHKWSRQIPRLTVYLGKVKEVSNEFHQKQDSG